MTDWNIPDLINPKKLIKIDFKKNYSKLNLIELLEKMLLIRLVENKLANEKEKGNIGGPIHLGAGQEAIAVGISSYIKKTDRVFGAHRSHSHVLSQGSDLRSFFAEILGKDKGLSRGMGGSMHMWDQPNGFYGSVPIVAGTVPLALGAGYAAKIDKQDDIAVAYLGDSAMEEGVVHESLNLASLLEIPIIFVVENNMFGSHMHINYRQTAISTARFAKANNIDYEIVDGNNVIEIEQVSKKAIENARLHNKPFFIEAITYRFYGHVDWREDVDVGINRSLEDLKSWKSNDPILLLKNAMIENSFLNEDYYKKLEIKMQKKIDSAWNKALNDPYPKLESLLNRVYK